MTPAEQNAITRIALCNSETELRAYMRNSQSGHPIVYAAAFDRLISVCASKHDDPIARTCWTMVHLVEELRRRSGRKVSRMNRLRPKIAKEGERAALVYCAKNRTEGFQEILDYNRPELTAEAIILANPSDFPDIDLRTKAKERLEEAGIDLADLFMRSDVDRLDSTATSTAP